MTGYESVLDVGQYTCSLCGYICRNTVQTCRGEIACSSCYSEALKRNPGLCPIDNEEATEIYKDMASDKEIGEIDCYCTNKKNNCKWIGPIKSLKDHELVCSKRFEQMCPMDCGQNIKFCGYQKHLLVCRNIENEKYCAFPQHPGCEREWNKIEKKQLLENTCYNGRMLWKIDNLEYRMKQAVDGKVTALHSAPCFTKKSGYKFCTRLYLNGDGIGRDSHVSLFFVLMRSEYDALLEWPFREKVTFRLLSANDVRGLDIRETFLPDRTSTSFQKPVREMNVAAGCPTFITIDELKSGKYVIGNSIFIETVVG
ncbi:TNF receptor-associated factor 5-like [Hydractinia symbiolongicarpus]|uniref:TNF receptor-associated factor 5-like n=1 Tax=Hydractinia symbiolongicarpus TaxID=13093 RepID=UPI00254EEC34|nr:TNF receptor-associated factor 5-like [Hydractinia symbiolongicarpus]